MTAPNVEAVKNVAVVGAGLIGAGVVPDYVLAGHRVQLISRSEESVRRGVDSVRDMLATMVDLGLVDREQVAEALPRLSAHVGLQGAVEDADIVYEAVYEDLSLKQQVFGELYALCPPRTVLVSGTSVLALKDIASATGRPDRTVLAHYANPPYLVPLVEVMRNQDTSDETVAVVCDFLTGVGKRPIVIQEEVPGFVTNRLQGALLREALALVQKGVVSAQDVDTVLKQGIGRRWAVAGVFEVFDIAGQDLIMAAAEYLLPHLENSTEVPQLLRDKVERGELGVKTGKGFYEWDPEAADAARHRIAHALVEIEKWSRDD